MLQTQLWFEFDMGMKEVKLRSSPVPECSLQFLVAPQTTLLYSASHTACNCCILSGCLLTVQGSSRLSSFLSRMHCCTMLDQPLLCLEIVHLSLRSAQHC